MCHFHSYFHINTFNDNPLIFLYHYATVLLLFFLTDFPIIVIFSLMLRVTFHLRDGNDWNSMVIILSKRTYNLRKTSEYILPQCGCSCNNLIHISNIDSLILHNSYPYKCWGWNVVIAIEANQAYKTNDPNKKYYLIHDVPSE